MDIVWILILCIHRPDPRVPYEFLSPRFLAGDNTGPDHYGVRCVGVMESDSNISVDGCQ